MTMTEKKDQVQLSVGDMAPDFTLPSHNEGELNLAWYRGRKTVVLAFYPADWTPVCANQIPGYSKIIEQFDKYDCQLLAVSVDSIPCHIAWARSLGGIRFPLMSDFWPHGEVARKYGVLTRKGYTERVVFLIDKEGIIRYIERVPIMELPDNDRLFEEIARLR
jgi:peroxiredoxin